MHQNKFDFEGTKSTSGSDKMPSGKSLYMFNSLEKNSVSNENLGLVLNNFCRNYDGNNND